jgi:hypothetical protein
VRERNRLDRNPRAFIVTRIIDARPADLTDHVVKQAA